MRPTDAQEYRLAVLGGGAVGKSAITLRMVGQDFQTEYDPTIEDSYQKMEEIDGEQGMLDILDTAGQEEYVALQDHWIREAEAFLLVFAIDSQKSFQFAKDMYTKISRNKEDEKLDLILIGNKSDLEQNRQVSLEEGKKLAEQWNTHYIETSAKTNKNIQHAFHTIVRMMRGTDTGLKPPENPKPQKDEPVGCQCLIL